MIIFKEIRSVMRSQCQECGGMIDLTNSVPLLISCYSMSIAHPCKGCGRLYFSDGSPAFSRAGLKAFLRDGQIILKEEEVLLQLKFSIN